MFAKRLFVSYKGMEVVRNTNDFLNRILSYSLLQVLELIAGWEQFNTDLGAITAAAPDLVSAIQTIVANKPTCS